MALPRLPWRGPAGGRGRCEGRCEAAGAGWGLSALLGSLRLGLCGEITEHIVEKRCLRSCMCSELYAALTWCLTLQRTRRCPFFFFTPQQQGCQLQGPHLLGVTAQCLPGASCAGVGQGRVCWAAQGSAGGRGRCTAYCGTLMLLLEGLTEKCLMECREQTEISNKSMPIRLFSY